MFHRQIKFFSTGGRRNPYDSKSMADVYDRPVMLYQTIVDAIKRTLQLDKPVDKLLDVGCGTGISTEALKEIASHVIGIDPALEMLKKAKFDPNIKYQHGFAEALPTEDQQFDIVTACVAFHFFDKAAFFKEAARALKDNGHLVISYTNFTGLDTEAFQTWKKKILREKYPPTAANRHTIDEELLNDDFPAYKEESIRISTEVDIHTLAALIMTMSGPGEAMQQKKNSQDSIREWVRQELKPFFKDSERLPFYWDIKIWSLQRAPRLSLDTAYEGVITQQGLSKGQ